MIQTAIDKLSNVSSDLHDLTLEAVFGKKLIDDDKYYKIENIKINVHKASLALDKVMVSSDSDIATLEKVVQECLSSLHEINSNMKPDLIKQNAEDDYAELSAQIVCLREQIERLRDS